MTRFETGFSQEYEDDRPAVDIDVLEQMKKEAPFLFDVQRILAKRYANQTGKEFSEEVFSWWIKTFAKEFREYIANDPVHAKSLEEFHETNDSKHQEELLKKIEEDLYSAEAALT